MGEPMTDKLSETLARLDRVRAPNLYRPDVEPVIEAARRWASFPTDEDVEAAATEIAALVTADAPTWQVIARAALEAVKREDR